MSKCSFVFGGTSRDAYFTSLETFAETLCLRGEALRWLCLRACAAAPHITNSSYIPRGLGSDNTTASISQHSQGTDDVSASVFVPSTSLPHVTHSTRQTISSQPRCALSRTGHPSTNSTLTYKQHLSPTTLIISPLIHRESTSLAWVAHHPNTHTKTTMSARSMA